MFEKLNEIPKEFIEFIPLDKKMTRAEAISYLGLFHNVDDQRIKQAFPSLDDSKILTAQFVRSKQSGALIIALRLYDQEDKQKQYYCINPFTGEYVPTVS